MIASVGGGLVVRTLTERDIIRFIREEYDRRLNDALNISPFPGQIDKSEPVITPNLKVRHIKTGYLYTVDSVKADEIVLQTPEGSRFAVGLDEFEKEYKLD